MHNLQNALDFPNFLLLQDSNMILLFLGLFVILEIQPLLGVQVLQEYNLHIILKEIQLCRILLMICEGQVFHLNWIYIFKIIIIMFPTYVLKSVSNAFILKIKVSACILFPSFVHFRNPFRGIVRCCDEIHQVKDWNPTWIFFQ